MKRPRKPTRDPHIEMVVDATRNTSNADIYHNTFLCRGTIAKLRERRPGKPRTRYPTHMTMVGVAAAVGLEWRLVKK